MTDTITIPPAALEAAAKAAYNKWRDKIRAEERDTMDADMLDACAPEWDDLGRNQQDWIEQTRAACLAMLRAWHTEKHKMIGGVALDEVGGQYPAIILPLTEPSDDK